MLKKLLGSDASVAAPVVRRNPVVKRRVVKKHRRARGWIA